MKRKLQIVLLLGALLGLSLNTPAMATTKKVGTAASKKTSAKSAKLGLSLIHIWTLSELIEGADVFLGLSAGGVLKQEMVAKMAAHPMVLALALSLIHI